MFAWLFTQYRKPGKLHFGSKWMNLHGRVFIGNPESFGLQDCRENVLKSFYYLRADRKMPVGDDGEYDAWKLDALRASQVRHASEKHISKAGFLAVSATCLVLCFGAMVVNKGKAGFSAPSLGGAALSLNECKQKYGEGTLQREELIACEALAKQEMGRTK
ncbi:hypothetical protein [Stenotrophomonas indicatrix]|uniref:hypothetical protein n=1 Tax=Stenotrophomonas indicatrix TaxID=2045451 RepID=UPI003441BF3B